MTTPIPIGKIGRITSGDEQGSYVKVQDDRANTGGYLVLLGKTSDFSEGSDDWVQDVDQLKRYFEASAWTVEWLE